MKRLSISQLNFLFFALLGIYSCSKEAIDPNMKVALNKQSEHLNQKETNLSLTSGSGFMGDIRTDPALEWWDTEEGTMPAPYIYDIYTGGTSPESQVATNLFAHYVSILWNSYPPYYGSAGNNYRMLQIQYKPQGGSSWYYPIMESPQNDDPWGVIYKRYGLYPRTVDPVRDYPIDLSSTYFPYGYIKIRIRVVSNNFPGPNIGTASHPEYDKSLASRWYDYNERWNEYGINRPQPTPNNLASTWKDEKIDDDGVLNVKVSLPEDNGGYTYSYYVTVGGLYVNGAKAPWGPEGSHNISKPGSSGIARAVATQTYYNLNGAMQQITRTKMMQYSASDKTVSFTFSKTDF